MTLHPATDPTVSNSLVNQTKLGIEVLDRVGGLEPGTAFARWTNRALIFFIILFSLSLPHSIAASQISLGLSLIAWAARDLSIRRLNFARLPIDLPLSAFALLTIVSSVFSVEPSLSMPKLKGLILFGVIYLIATNVGKRGLPLLATLLIVSSLAGVGFSLSEKVFGRGMIITAIEADSPLAGSSLLPGDVIWMVDRTRVHSTEEAGRLIKAHPIGDIIELGALHEGDPVPVALTVTEELKARDNPLGVIADGSTRKFRVSGFSRQFITYAEQMQILGMLAFGGLLASLRRRRKKSMKIWIWIFVMLLALFALALALTATRAVIASFILAALVCSINIGSRQAMLLAAAIVLTLGGIGYFVIKSSRNQAAINFKDDSANRRLAYMQAGIRLIPKRPLIGVGMDSHKRHWSEWGFPGDYITHTHSTPIQIAVDRGIPALGTYFWLIVAMALMAWQNYKRSRRSGYLIGEILCLGGFGALLAFSMSSLANYNFGDSEVVMLLLFIIGLISVIENAKNKVEGDV